MALTDETPPPPASPAPRRRGDPALARELAALKKKLGEEP